MSEIIETRDHYLIRASEYEIPSEGVVTAVSDITGRAANELPILYETIDPDGLNAAVEDGDMTVEFDYAGFTVVVETDAVRLVPQTDYQ